MPQLTQIEHIDVRTRDISETIATSGSSGTSGGRDVVTFGCEIPEQRERVDRNGWGRDEYQSLMSIDTMNALAPVLISNLRITRHSAGGHPAIDVYLTRRRK